MNLPAAVRAGAERALGGRTVADVSRVGGGCISPAARLTMSDGASFFVKWLDDAPAGLFEAEARGLAAIRAARAVPVPETVAVDPGWLMLEWLPPSPAGPATWARLGRELAALHAVRADGFGAADDNFIGPLPQSNRWSSSWADFWRDRRLAPQLERAAPRFSARQRDRLQRFVEEGLDELIAAGDADGPSLLHGDLWSGNVHVTTGGRAALIDPSSYYGHREVDLAMAALFGGFERAFFEACEAESPLAAGWPERRAAYQLYYLLVHVDLFGAGYVGRTLQALEAAGG